MTYRIELAPAAARQLGKLELSVCRRVQAAIELLMDDQRPSGATRLVGGEGEWRVRTGNCRVGHAVLRATTVGNDAGPRTPLLAEWGGVHRPQRR